MVLAPADHAKEANKSPISNITSDPCIRLCSGLKLQETGKILTLAPFGNEKPRSFEKQPDEQLMQMKPKI